jgi:hypothetical protein
VHWLGRTINRGQAPANFGGNTMKLAGVIPVVLLSGAAGAATAQVAPAAYQMKAAVRAAPEGRREGATIMGYDAAGKFVTLRKGTNDIVCMADDPSAEGFEVSCHHDSLEPYFARGRELAAQKIQDRNAPRWKEIEAGTLKFPTKQATNYIMTGSGFDAATGTIRDAYLRWVIYTPFATEESTGLTTQGSVNAPWLMFPGTPGAHIMITPPRPKAAGS